LGQLLDRVAAVLQDAAVAVDVGDGAARGGGVGEARVVHGQARVVLGLTDPSQVGGADAAVGDLDLVLLAGAIVSDGQRLLFGHHWVSCDVREVTVAGVSDPLQPSGERFGPRDQGHVLRDGRHVRPTRFDPTRGRRVLLRVVVLRPSDTGHAAQSPDFTDFDCSEKVTPCARTARSLLTSPVSGTSSMPRASSSAVSRSLPRRSCAASTSRPTRPMSTAVTSSSSSTRTRSPSPATSAPTRRSTATAVTRVA